MVIMWCVERMLRILQTKKKANAEILLEMLQDHWTTLRKRQLKFPEQLKRWDHEMSFKSDNAKQDRQRHT